MHRPSADQLWQIPPCDTFPVFAPGRCADVPLEAHEASYFAASVSIASFFARSGTGNAAGAFRNGCSTSFLLFASTIAEFMFSILAKEPLICNKKAGHFTTNSSKLPLNNNFNG